MALVVRPLRLVSPTALRSTVARSFGKKVRRSALTMSAEAPVRVRFAPSPTGSLHVGGARTALFNWLKARQAGGSFVLRIEDTDTARSTRASEESMKADLRWLGLDWDEGPDVGGPHAPYRQSERGEIYKKYSDQLIAEGKAYPCFTTEAELDELRAAAEAKGEPSPVYDGTWRDADPSVVAAKVAAGDTFAVRFKVEPGSSVSINDLVRGTVTWDADATVGDFVLMRSTGVPVYNFCVAVDDATMGITHVVRAEEHLTNTLRQGLVLEALGFPMPTYAHASLILGEDRSKLSKRHGATSVDQFKQEGYVREAMINYLAGLGWNDGSEREIYAPGDVVEAFALDRVTKAPSMFDTAKLKWVNGQHIRAMPPADLAPLLQPFVQAALLEPSAPPPEALVDLCVALAQDKIELLTDAVGLLQRVVAYSLPDAVTTAEAKPIVDDDFGSVALALLALYDNGQVPSGGEGDEFDATWKAMVKSLGKATGRKGKGLFMPLRLALTGNVSGPDVGVQLKVVCAAGGAMAHVVPLAERMAQLRAWASDPLNQKAAPPPIDEASHAAAVRAAVEALPAASVVRSQCLAALAVVDESVAASGSNGATK